MRIKISVLLTLLLSISLSSYIPELILTTTSDFLNKKLPIVGPAVTNYVNHNLTIQNITFNETYAKFVHIEMNLTQIKQNVSIGWNTMKLQVDGPHNFSLYEKNINVTLKGNLSFFIASQKIRQNGQLQINIVGLDTQTNLSFIGSSCTKGIGFGLFINDIQINNSTFHITIHDTKGKQIDKRVISLIESLLRSKGANLINTKIRSQINSVLQSTTCNSQIEQVFGLGNQTYILSINTTQVPYFASNKYLTLPLDINFQNQKTNQTNQQVDNENLVDEHIYQGKANCTLSLSSNMIDTIMWLVDDSKILSVNVSKYNTKAALPIDLDTSGLAILLPGLKKYPNKDVIIRVNTSSQFSQIFIRSGRFISGLSISADFIINETGRVKDLQKCLSKKQCFVAASLNITLGVSASIRAQNFNIWSGLIQSLYVHQITVIHSLIDIKVDNLMKIINPLISSARPQINKVLQQGIAFNPSSIKQLDSLNLTGLIGQTFLDYASFGLLFDS